MRNFYEFFAGGGMVRAGLGAGWECLFSNDFDHKKARVYRENWGTSPELKVENISLLQTNDLPSQANLAWASFPCQDLSLAGAGAGLKGERSGTFWPFWDLMRGLIAEQRSPEIIVLENVCGTMTSHSGTDFATICATLCDGGYAVGAVVIDAILFVPQSRPRLFFIGVRRDVKVPAELINLTPTQPWHNKTLTTAYEKLSDEIKKNWIWWNLPLPRSRRLSLTDILEEDPTGVTWFSVEETERLLSLMSEVNQAKLVKAKQLRRRIVGGVYKRTRRDEYGRKAQRAEIRFDDVAGCLRTPAGGSSRQVIVVVEGSSVRARLISSRETARLMGLRDSYRLPGNYNDAYHLTGDGVVVPVVRHLRKFIFEPLLTYALKQEMRAA